MPQAALVVGAVASVAGTVASYSQQRKAAKLSRKQQQVATRRSRRQAIRQAQIQRAQAVASAQATGALGSSGASGGIGSLGSQLGEALGFSTQMSGLSAGISSAQQKAATYGGIAQLGGTLFSYGYNQGARFSDLKPNKAQTTLTNFDAGLYGRSAGQPQ